MATQSKKPYLMVWGALAVLTVAEIFAALVLDGTSKWTALVILASVKAGSVAWWYMHLKHEYGWLKLIAALPMAAVVYAILLMNEVVAR
jgi:caa(3)-type oxidase subunit IV